jgi:RNA polymerase sigma factor (sigma-70 family)
MAEWESAKFQKTQWSLVLAAGENGLTRDGEDALDLLLTKYRPPLVTYARKLGYGPEEAEDLVQDFVQRLLRRGDIAQVSPEKGKFRTFLKAALANFLRNDVEKRNAAKRGGGVEFTPIGVEEAEGIPARGNSSNLSPDEACDQHWRRIVITSAIGELRGRCKARGKEALFEALLPCLSGPDAEDYARIASQLNLTQNTIRVTVFRLKKELGDLIDDEIRKTVGSHSSFEEERREFYRTS